MIKVLDAAELVRRLYPELLERSRAAGVNRPLEITFGLPDEQLRLTLTRRSVRLESESRSRSQDVLCNEETLHRLLTSQLDLADAVDGGEIRFSKKRTQKTLAALFPFIPLWRPTFDDLQA